MPEGAPPWLQGRPRLLQRQRPCARPCAVHLRAGAEWERHTGDFFHIPGIEHVQLGGGLFDVLAHGHEVTVAFRARFAERNEHRLVNGTAAPWKEWLQRIGPYVETT